MLIRRRVNSAGVGGSERYASPYLRGSSPGSRGRKRVGSGRCRPSSAPVAKSHCGVSRPRGIKSRWTPQSPDKEGATLLKIEGKAIRTQITSLPRKNSQQQKSFEGFVRSPPVAFGTRMRQTLKESYTAGKNYDWFAEETNSFIRKQSDQDEGRFSSKESSSFGQSLLLNNFFLHSYVSDEDHASTFSPNSTNDELMSGINGLVAFTSSSEDDPLGMRPTIRLVSRRTSVQPWVESYSSSQENSNLHTQTDSVSNDECSESTVLSLGKKIQQMAQRDSEHFQRCTSSELESTEEESNMGDTEWRKMLSRNHSLIMGDAHRKERPISQSPIPEEYSDEIAQPVSILKETSGLNFASLRNGEPQHITEDGFNGTRNINDKTDPMVRQFEGNLIQKLNQQRLSKNLNRKLSRSISEESDENVKTNSNENLSQKLAEDPDQCKITTHKKEVSFLDVKRNEEKVSDVQEQNKIARQREPQDTLSVYESLFSKIPTEHSRKTSSKKYNIYKSDSFEFPGDKTYGKDTVKNNDSDEDKVTKDCESLKPVTGSHKLEADVTIMDHSKANKLYPSEEKRGKNDDNFKHPNLNFNSPLSLTSPFSQWKPQKQQSKSIIEALDMIEKNQNKDESKIKLDAMAMERYSDESQEESSVREMKEKSKTIQNKEKEKNDHVTTLIQKIKIFVQELAEIWKHGMLSDDQNSLQDLSDAEKALKEICLKEGLIEVEKEKPDLHRQCEESKEKLKKEMDEKIGQNMELTRKLLDDKRSLTEKCEQHSTSVTQNERAHLQKVKLLQERHTLELKAMKEKIALADQSRREKWTQHKVKLIKDSAYRNLETKLKELTGQHTEEIARLKEEHRRELRESEDEWVAKLREETDRVKIKFEQEKEEACRWEREREAERYQQELERSDSTWQNRLEVSLKQFNQTKTAWEEESQRQMNRLKADHEDEMRTMKRELEITKEEYEEKIRRMIKDHEREILQVSQGQDRTLAELREKMVKESEETRQKFEKEIRERFRRQRDKEIEKAIAEIQQETASQIEEKQRACNTKIKSIKERYEGELRDLEECERISHARYLEMKGVLAQKEEEIIYLRARLHAQSLEMGDFQRMFCANN